MKLRFAILTLAVTMFGFGIGPGRATPVIAREVPQDFVSLVERLGPAVVNISTAQTIEIDAKSQFKKGSPLEKFNDFFGGGEANRIARALGSGFVIDKDGYIVTNNHVIEGADEIEVAFPNGESYEAKLIGRDSATDLALLKIKAGKELPFVSFAGPDSAKVGEWVIAIGNPLGYSSSVAAGIVSARHRQMSMTSYDDFIQTDVAINKGNSGGPLFNMRGEVVGVNTAIVSPTGFSVGLSFSIPSDLAASVVRQLRENGEVRRGFLGVHVQKVSPGIAKSYKLDKPYGALIRTVTKDSPAGKAGLKRGDLITALGGQPLKNAAQLARIIAEAKIDAPLEVEFIRKKKKKKVTVTIERLKTDKKDKEKNKSQNPLATGNRVMGISVEPIDDKLRAKLRLEEDVQGVRVADVNVRSPASGKLRKGDILIEINQEPIEGMADFMDKMRAAQKTGDPILVLLLRGGSPVFYSLAGK